MPIRFRCAYCNQLMGIARRKAGTVVRCPTCAGQVVVPTPGPSSEAAPEGPENTGQALFEQSNFDQIFAAPPPVPPATAPGNVSAPAAPAAPPAAAFPPLAPLPKVDVEKLEGAGMMPLGEGMPDTPGIFLSTAKLTLLSVVVVVLLGLAFGAGLLVGINNR
jgi:hypothetical protein